MKRGYNFSEGGPVSEMAIVATFTKLIFGEDDCFDSGELIIIQAVRMADPNLMFDSHRDMGIYLRALGVQEMIDLVGRVRELLQGTAPTALERSDTSRTGGQPRIH